MKEIEKRMQESPYADRLTVDEPNRLQATDHGSDRYTQWINSLERPIARIPEQDYRRFFVSCQRNLEVLTVLDTLRFHTCHICTFHVEK